MDSFPALTPALPELVLLATACFLLIFGVFRRTVGGGLVTLLALTGMLVALAMVAFNPVGVGSAFGGLFSSDAYTDFMKGLILVGAMVTLIMARSYRERENLQRFEYSVLLVFATLGMAMMVSANNLMALYIGVEMQSLPLYVMAAFKRDSRRSGEAGLKYFILGALSSGLLLYGCSLIYGYTGTTDFAALADAVSAGPPSVGLLVGLVLLVSGIAFKASAVPFHMWTPDVYEGAPTAVTAFFAAAPKVAALALLTRVLVEPFGALVEEWRQVVVCLSVASMLLGAFAAIRQTNVKRLMAYSSIGHVGYALVGLAAGGVGGVRSVIIYLAIYLVMTIGVFACILAMRRRGRMVEGIIDLAGLGRTHPMLAAALAILMFSMAGIPPLAGFFGKFYVFLAAVEAGLYPLAVIGVLTSVVAAFYYVRIVKLMYFDEAGEPFDRPFDREVGVVAACTSLLVLLFFVYPAPLVSAASAAAVALLS